MLPTDKGENMITSFKWIIRFLSNTLSAIYGWVVDLFSWCVTGKTSLERILLDGDFECKMTINVRNLLLNQSRYSKQVELLKQPSRLPIEEFCASLVQLDNIKTPLAISNLRNCSLQLENTNICLEYLFKRKKISYDQNNSEHEKLLLSLWDALETVPLDNRISSEWKRLGFQSENPATDFRGMGILGLENLLHFSNHETNSAKDIVGYGSEAIGYPFAITGINITSLLLDLIKDRFCDDLFIRIPSEEKEVEGVYFNILNELYNRTYIRFHQFYLDSEKETLCDFPRIFGEFEEVIRKESYFGRL